MLQRHVDLESIALVSSASVTTPIELEEDDVGFGFPADFTRHAGLRSGAPSGHGQPGAERYGLAQSKQDVMPSRQKH